MSFTVLHARGIWCCSEIKWWDLLWGSYVTLLLEDRKWCQLGTKAPRGALDGAAVRGRFLQSSAPWHKYMQELFLDLPYCSSSTARTEAWPRTSRVAGLSQCQGPRDKSAVWWTKACCCRWMSASELHKHTGYRPRVAPHSPLSIALSPGRARSGCRLAPFPRSSRLRTGDAVLTAFVPASDQAWHLGWDGEPCQDQRHTHHIRIIKATVFTHIWLQQRTVTKGSREKAKNKPSR